VGETQVVDWGEALSSVNGDRVLLRDIVDAFVDEAPRILQMIRQAIDEQDSKLLRRAAHTLKSSTGYFGARRASEMALRLESLGRDDRLQMAASLSEELEREIVKLVQNLVDYREGRIEIGN
jgi:two-component system, sensor histidine kinase and response regulator